MHLKIAVVCMLVTLVLKGCQPQQPAPVARQPIAPHGTVALELRSIEPVAHFPGWTLRCQTAFQNETGADLRVMSYRGLPIDSMDIVVMDKDGNELSRKNCAAHSSMFFPEGRWTSLPVGETVQQLDFLIGDIPAEHRDCQAVIVGTLPGSDYEKALSSNTIKLRLP